MHVGVADENHLFLPKIEADSRQTDVVRTLGELIAFARRDEDLAVHAHRQRLGKCCELLHQLGDVHSVLPCSRPGLLGHGAEVGPPTAATAASPSYLRTNSFACWQVPSNPDANAVIVADL